MQLHNRINRKELKAKMASDPRPYRTISFYVYHRIKNVPLFRDHLYLLLTSLEVVGRIYVAEEGINAQIALPEENISPLKNKLSEITFLDGIRLNIAVDESDKSLFKLDIKIRNKIVADGIDDPHFDPSNKGNYLNAEKWNEYAEKPNTVIIDMRNHYESEVGHFKGAKLPDSDTFRDELKLVIDEFKNQKDKTILMYCTGGIRCEKASAWMKYNGFNEVYHLEGGIINYVRQVKEKGLENKFIGVNFVFDERLHERITDDIISHCHQCGHPADRHTNCANVGCHALFIQCDDCATKFEGCCSEDCMQILKLPEDLQKSLRKGKVSVHQHYRKGRTLKQ